MEGSKTVGHDARLERGFETRRVVVVECFVPTCDSRMGSVSRRNNVTFHSFPKRQSLRLQWKRAVRSAEQPGDASRVCSLHFREDDFKSEALRNLLNEDAVPSLRLLATQRQTRYQARLATEPTEPDNGAAVRTDLDPSHSSEETISADEDVFASERQGSPPQWGKAATPEPPATLVRARRQRRNQHFSSNKVKNRLRRAKRQGGRAPAASTAGEANRNKKKKKAKTYSDKIREFREALVGGRRSTRIGRWGETVRSPPVGETSPPSNSLLALKTYPPKSQPLKRFVALAMDVAPSPARPESPTRKPFVALEMDVGPSSPNRRTKLSSGKSFVVFPSDTRARLLGGRKTQKKHTAEGQACCVPGCVTSHEPVFSFPADPCWKARWNKSIFGDSKRSSRPQVLESTCKDGSKIYVHRRQLKMPIAAYRSLFKIPGWGQSKGVADRPTVVIDERRRTRQDSMVCSAHFLDGKPTAMNPIPRLNLPPPSEEEIEGAEVSPEVHDDHTYAAEALSDLDSLDGQTDDERDDSSPEAKENDDEQVDSSPEAKENDDEQVDPSPEAKENDDEQVDPSPEAKENALPTRPKQTTDVMPEVSAPPQEPPAPPALPNPPGAETVARRWGKTDRCMMNKECVDHRDHTYALMSELDDLDRSDHTYAFVISDVKNTDSTIWGQYSVSPLAQACYTTGTTESFTEDQDLFYATVKQEVEDDFDASALATDRRFASDWEQLPVIKQEPAEAEPEPECGSFHFVDVSNFMNDYRADFEDLGSLDPVLASK